MVIKIRRSEKQGNVVVPLFGVLLVLVAVNVIVLNVVEERKSESFGEKLKAMKVQVAEWKREVDVLQGRLVPILQSLKDHYDSDILTGIASWYGPRFDGKLAADGKIFQMFAMTAAHRELPLGSRVRIENMVNGKSAVVTITDRGPFIMGRIIDVSLGVAQELEMVEMGLCPVKIMVIR